MAHHEKDYSGTGNQFRVLRGRVQHLIKKTPSVMWRQGGALHSPFPFVRVQLESHHMGRQDVSREKQEHGRWSHSKYNMNMVRASHNERFVGMLFKDWVCLYVCVCGRREGGTLLRQQIAFRPPIVLLSVAVSPQARCAAHPVPRIWNNQIERS